MTYGTNETIGDWEKVGVIGVDAGLCWVGDPCYILHQDDGEEPKAIGKDWGEFCDTLYGANGSIGATQYNYDAGHPGLGVVVSTGWGDGEYDVLVRKTKEGRVAEVKVVFLEEVEDDDIEDDIEEPE